MRCPHCRTKLGPDGSHICPACGQNIGEAVAQPTRRCPACGAKMPGGAQVCPICGARTPKRRLRFASALFSGLAGIATALVLLGALWILKPWAQTAPPTPTLTPSATATRIATKTLTPTPTSTITPSPTPGFFRHTVISGDTLAFIAEQYGVTTEAIRAVNEIGDGEYLLVGEVLVIPLSPDLIPSTPSPTPEEPTPTPRGPTSTSQASTSTPGVLTPTPTPEALTPTPTPEVPTPTPTPIRRIHIVAEGENLRIIAKRYGTTVEAIAEANDITNPEMIQVGQELLIPGLAVTPTVTPSPAVTLPPPTSTPGWKFRTPTLLGPVDGEAFSGQDAEILLNWASVGILAADEWYVLRIRTEAAESGQDEGTSRSEWTKNTSWRVPDWMYPASKDDPDTFKWDVTIVKRPPEGPPEALSPRSSSRSFSWH